MSSPPPPQEPITADQLPKSPPTPERCVREDLSDLKNTLTRQLWGVASFLAPPPQQQPESVADVAAGEGIRGDLAEIGGKVRSGISKLSNLLQLGAGEEEEREGGRGYDVVGVTEEVVAFAKDLSVHPDTWLNFPLPDDDDEFELSDAQQDHALAVESLAPGLASLRMELCPGYMSESCFWKIYFVLLHPKLNKHDALDLSTPQILEARAFLTPELRNRPRARLEQDFSERNTSNINDIPVASEAPSELVPLDNRPATGVNTSTKDTDVEIEKHQIQSTQIPIVDKSVVNEGPAVSSSNPGLSSKMMEEKIDDDGDEWLEEESVEIVGAAKSTVHIEDDEDVSFSDLEED